MFSNLKTGHRLALSFGAVVALIVLIAIATTLRIQAINQHITEIIDDRAVKVALATDLDQGVNVQARFLRNALIGHKDPEEMRNSLDRVQKAVDENTETLAKIEKLINTPVGQKLFKAIVDARAPYGKGRNEVISMLQAGQVEEAGAHLLKEVRPKQDAFFAAIEEFSVAQKNLMDEAGNKAKAEGVLAIRLSLGAAVLGMLLAAGLGFVMTRSLVRELGGEPAAARDLASAIASGDLTHTVEVAATDRDSLMARLALMQTNLQQIVSGVRANA